MSDWRSLDSENQNSAGIQKIEGKQQWVHSTITNAYEIVRDDKDTSIIPEIRLKEGWRNGNILIGTGAPTSDLGHTWDVYLDVPAGTDWTLVSNMYVKRPS